MMSDVDRYIYRKLHENPGGFLTAFLKACQLADSENMSILLPREPHWVTCRDREEFSRG
jgi:hypothetical protein